MESQPQNPEFRINPETFTHVEVLTFSLVSTAPCALHIAALRQDR